MSIEKKINNNSTDSTKLSNEISCEKESIKSSDDGSSETEYSSEVEIIEDFSVQNQFDKIEKLLQNSVQYAKTFKSSKNDAHLFKSSNEQKVYLTTIYCYYYGVSFDCEYARNTHI